MPDIKSARWLYIKGVLFVTLGCLASALLLLESPRFKTVVLLGVAIWSFARAYYFAFYVIQHYIDPQYKFAGLWDFMKYCLRQRSSDGQRPIHGDEANRKA